MDREIRERCAFCRLASRTGTVINARFVCWWCLSEVSAWLCAHPGFEVQLLAWRRQNRTTARLAALPETAPAAEVPAP